MSLFALVALAAAYYISYYSYRFFGWFIPSRAGFDRHSVSWLDFKSHTSSTIDMETLEDALVELHLLSNTASECQQFLDCSSYSSFPTAGSSSATTGNVPTFGPMLSMDSLKLIVSLVKRSSIGQSGSDSIQALKRIAANLLSTLNNVKDDNGISTIYITTIVQLMSTHFFVLTHN